MDLVKKINSFSTDIYFVMAPESLAQYVEIVNEFSDCIELNFKHEKEIIESKNQILERLSNLMDKQDFIAMSDALQYEVKPILEEMFVGGLIENS